MSVGAPGNNPELWDKLLNFLDERLQLGLLDHLKHTRSYHFEDKILTLQPDDAQVYDYLSKAAVFQQLLLLAQEATGIEKLKIERP